MLKWWSSRNNQWQETTQDDEDEDDFDNDFQNVDLSEAAHIRYQGICQEVDAKIRANIEEQQENWNHVGDAVGENGDVLCMWGAQMERHQYLGLKRIIFGLRDMSTVSGLDVVVTRFNCRH